MSIPSQRPIEYPEFDGKPMAETDVHRREMINAIETLQDRYRDVPDVYVAGNLLLYYEEGDPASSVAPDVFVVRGVPKRERRTYKLWEEGRGPDIVIEMSSRSTRLEDVGTKKGLYALLGVREYFLFDPLAEYLRPPLQGFRLHGADYVRLLPEADGSFYSEVLELRLRMEGSQLRLIDPATATALLTPAEAQEKARVEAEGRRIEAEARRIAEQRLAEAEAEIARLRAALAVSETGRSS
jgi:Uma2 family endonuclease